MPPDPSLLAAEQARRRVKRAAGLLREASRDLARATSDAPGIIATVSVVDADTEAQALALLRLERARRGELDVVLLPRPSAAPPQSGESRRGDPR